MTVSGRASGLAAEVLSYVSPRRSLVASCQPGAALGIHWRGNTETLHERRLAVSTGGLFRVGETKVVFDHHLDQSLAVDRRCPAEFSTSLGGIPKQEVDLRGSISR